jgi:tetratricopeptide (TPR) repeat protein/tRNA A-37 threonylcarbamoyl transferase component Bud32
MNLDDRLPDEVWLQRLREAEGAPAAGRIGPYEVVSEISRGGQGVVFRGRQPGTNRPVALKRLIGGRLAAGAARARFDREIEAVCALSHPNIVTVFGVETIDAQPVLAMEWIDGLPIDQWARGTGDEPRPSHEVLRTFLKVCAAVQHAHQRGVIHRDLKPSNILVDDAGSPHVVDFGLAKTAAADDSAAARLTLTQEFLGTPAYAAPEHVGESGVAVDARADVYALGAVLYELLCGRTPHDASRGLAAMLVAIRERDPAPPSSLSTGVDRDLDTITLKALAREPADRYQSVDALAADVQRYLAGEPVAAHPPSLSYQLRKLVRRHRVPFALAFTLIGLLVVFGVVATVLAVRLDRERLAAVQAGQREADAREAAEQVNAFLRDMLTAARPDKAQGRTVTVSEIVDLAITRSEGRFADQPAVEASVRLTLGETLRTLGRHDDAETQLNQALVLLRRVHSDTHPDIAKTLLNLAHTQRAAGELEACIRTYEEALAAYRALPDEEVQISVTLASAATAYLDLGRLDEAEALIREAIDTRAQSSRYRPSDDINEIILLASLQFHRGDFAAAEAILRPALDTALKELGENQEVTLAVISNLAVALKQQGRPQEAEVYSKQAMAVATTLFGPEHPRTILAMANYASLLQASARPEEAESLYRSTLETAERTIGLDHPTGISLAHNLASLLREQARYEEAETLFRDVLERTQRTLGERHPGAAMAMGLLAATIHAGRGDDAITEATKLYTDALAIFEETLPPGHPHIARTRELLAELQVSTASP